MAKLSPYDFRGMPQEVVDFKDEISNYWNFGKYSAIVVNTAPSWSARNGEFVFFNSANVVRTYFYNNNVWNFLEYPAAGGGLSNVSNMTVAVSNNVVTGSTTLLNVSNNLVTVSNNVVTGSTTLLNVSNNLITVSNNVATFSSVSTNLVNQGVKAWVSFNGSSGSVSILKSYGVTSVTRNAAGFYSIAWNPVFADTGYTVTIASRENLASPSVLMAGELSTLLVGTANFYIKDGNGTNTDSPLITVNAVGNQ